MKYYKSIDGLRALAISLVLFFHIDSNIVSGGFIGVDVFFVLSGFLISQLIFVGLKNGSFKFSNFFYRRITRLFPALFTVISASCLAAYFLIPAIDIEDFSLSALFSTFSLSNWFFYSEVGYFDSASELKPLLHTWSLSVEEQFYMFWPFFLFFVWRFSKDQKGILIAISLLIVASLFFTLNFVSTDESLVFYGTPSRVLQFGCGALVGIRAFGLTLISPKLLQIVCIAALCALGFLVTKDSGFFLAFLMPTILSVGLIWTCLGNDDSFALGNRYMVWLGEISYSVYLVHWPLIVFTKYSLDFTLTFSAKVLLLIGSVIAGYLLHILVEKRFRISGKDSERKLKFSILVSMLLLLTSVLASQAINLKARPENIDRELLEISNLSGLWQERFNLVRNGECNLDLSRSDASDFAEDNCLPVGSDEDGWLVVGDSYAAGMYASLSLAFPEIKFYQASLPGCSYTLNKGKIRRKGCRIIFDKVDAIVSSKSIKGVIVANNWENYSGDDMPLLINFAKEADVKLVIVGPRLVYKQKIPSIVSSSSSIENVQTRADKLIKNSKFVKDTNKSIVRAIEKSEYFINMVGLQCNDGACRVLDARNRMLYLDGSHFSGAGIILNSRTLNKHLWNGRALELYLSR